MIGWYAETGQLPLLRGDRAGVVLTTLGLRGGIAPARIPASVKRFGFYIQQQQGESGGYPSRRTSLAFTNNLLHDLAPNGIPVGHGLLGGRLQVLVFDVSRWLGAHTWMVAVPAATRSHRSGDGDIASVRDDREDDGDGDHDHDGSPLLFKVTGLAVTPTLGVTFAEVKSYYR